VKRSIPFILACSTFAFLTTGILTQETPYPWCQDYQVQQALVRRIPLPHGYRRIPLEPGSFGHWLRHLPLKKGIPPVFLHDGTRKPNQDAHAAVLDIDVGHRDLQQCADAIIRLRAEYLFFLGKTKDIHFRFTSGHIAKFQEWIEGFRPVVSGSKVRWEKSSTEEFSYANFRLYLNTVFMYAGTHSLNRELHPVTNIQEIKCGDVFIQPGFPGHAVMVADIALNRNNGNRVFLLIQSFMPAQDIHILKNPENHQLNPWYVIRSEGNLNTPEWRFSWDDLKRFQSE